MKLGKTLVPLVATTIALSALSPALADGVAYRGNKPASTSYDAILVDGGGEPGGGASADHWRGP
jgi:hypothetical protein